MDVLFSDEKKKEFRLRLGNLDDLWHMSHFISVGDTVVAQDERKVRFGDADTKSRTVRKVFSLSLSVKTVVFSEDVLRVSGTVVQGAEDVPTGSFHSFHFGIGDEFFLTKKKLLVFQKKHYDDAVACKKSSVLLVALDRESASFGLLQGYGLAYLGDISGTVEKKCVGHVASGDFFADVVAEIDQYVARYGLSTVVLGSPAFWKDEIYKRLSSSLASKVVLATCHHVGKFGLFELLKRSEVQRALARERLQRDVLFVENFLSVLRKDPSLVRYGLSDVLLSVQRGAVSVLLLTDHFLSLSRAEENSFELDSALEQCEHAKGEVHIVSSAHEAGAQIDGLGGVVCLLRYRLK